MSRGGEAESGTFETHELSGTAGVRYGMGGGAQGEKVLQRSRGHTAMSSLPAKGLGREAVCDGDAQEVSKKERDVIMRPTHIFIALILSLWRVD